MQLPMLVGYVGAALLSTSLLATCGCGASLSRYEARGAEVDQLESVERRFAYAARTGDVGPVAENYDIEARRGLLEMLSHQVRAGHRPTGFASAALVVTTGEALRGDDAVLEQGRTRAHAALDRHYTELAGAPLPPPLPHSDEARAYQRWRLEAGDDPLKPQREALAAIKIEGCLTASRASFRAQGLDGFGPTGDRYAAWDALRRRASAFHIVGLDCRDKRALLLLALDREIDTPLLLAFRFFTTEEWTAVRPALE